MLIVGAGRAGAADGAAILALALAAKAAHDRLGARQGRLERLQRAAHRASRVGALDLGFVPGEGGRDVRGILDGARQGEIDVLFCSAPTRSTSRPAARPSSSIRAPRRPRRASRRRDPAGRRLYRKDGTYVNTEGPRAARPRARSSRRATRARIGRSCARCPTCWARSCPTTRSPRCARAVPRIRISRGIDGAAPRDAATAKLAGRQGRRATSAPFVRAVDDFYLTNPIAAPARPWRNAAAIAPARARRRRSRRWRWRPSGPAIPTSGRGWS
jgi:NADH-quinone oxidoreductase subunit G